MDEKPLKNPLKKRSHGTSVWADGEHLVTVAVCKASGDVHEVERVACEATPVAALHPCSPTPLPTFCKAHPFRGSLPSADTVNVTTKSVEPK